MTLRKSLTLTLLPALLSIACSESAPPTPRGSLRMQIVPPSQSDLASRCQFPNEEAYVGGDESRQYPDQYQPGARVVDHEGGAEVSCSVRSTKDGMFFVEGHMRRGVADLTVSGELPGTLDGGSGTGTGRASIVTSATVGQSLGPDDTKDPTPCVFTPVEVAPGRAWAAFDCSPLKASGQENTFCGVKGYFVFENCSR